MSFSLIAVVLLSACLLYRYIGASKFNSSSTAEEVSKGIDLTGKIAVVTGANSGMGKESTRVLLKRGASVIMACRSPKRAETALNEILEQCSDDKNSNGIESNQRLATVVLDLSSLQSVFEFIGKFKKTISQWSHLKSNHINILMNNAGICGVKEWTLNDAGYEMQFATNVIGHFALSELIIDYNIALYRKQSNDTDLSAIPHLRIVNLSSLAHMSAPLRLENYLSTLNKEERTQNKDEYDPIDTYGFTKACNILLTTAQQRRYGHTNIISVSVRPGTVYTNLLRNADMNRWYQRLVLNIATSQWFAKSVEQGAATQVMCATMSGDDIKAGQYYALGTSFLLRLDLRGSLSIGAQDQLWELCCKLVVKAGFKLPVSNLK